MKRAAWPQDDGPRLPRGQRRVRLYFVGTGKAFQILSAHYSRQEAERSLASAQPSDARIRRAVASVRWVDA